MFGGRVKVHLRRNMTGKVLEKNDLKRRVGGWGGRRVLWSKFIHMEI